MKKLLTLSLALAASAAMADPIDLQKAQSIAQEYLTAGQSPTLVTRAQRTPAKARSLAPGVAATSPYYVFSRGEGRGFVIVSGDDCLPQVLGYTEQGDFDPQDMPPALRDMLECYARAVEDAQADGTNIRLDESRIKQRATTKRTNIAPFVSSHWHQSSPYNDRCPRITSNGNKALTGCVATAASQILYYWRRDLPNTLQSTTPTYGYGDAPVTESLPKGTPLKWELMRDQYGSEPAEYKEAVADLVFATGAATWLTYGSSTSGNIEKIPATFSGFFGMNGGWVAYRDSYSQEGWTQLIYDELAKGHPVMYTGVHPNNGGHAVFIHGYQASTDKFYFNFGWGAGNGYDGYYTTTQTDGMNGFCGYQSALIGAYPKKWNMTATVTAPTHVYANVDNNFKVTVENNSTLDYSGIYLFATTSKTKPTSLKDARSYDDEYVIPVGGSHTLILTAKPTTVRTWYITVTDNNLNILAQIPVETENPEAKLRATGLHVNGLAQKETLAGHDYTVVAGAKALVSVDMTNLADAAFGGSAKLDIYSSEDDGQTFTLLKTVSKSNTVVEGNGQAVVEFGVTGIEAGTLCQAMVSESWGLSSAKVDVDATDVEPVYFKVLGSADLSATLNGDELVFHGTWDAATYTTVVGRSGNKTALNYDLTDVQGVSEVPAVEYPNANALIYAPAQATGTNVITTDGVCAQLRLVPGATFQPRAAFRAQSATLTLDDSFHNWNLVTLPFACPVPDGMQARRIDSHKVSTTGIYNATTDLTELEAGQTYLLITAGNSQLSAAQVDVVAEPTANADAALVGTFTSVAVPAGGKLVTLNADGLPYFTKAATDAVAGALTGYFYDEKMASIDFRAYTALTLDPVYMDLAAAIRQMQETYLINKDIVSDEANALMTDSIAGAQHTFATKEITASSQLKAYIKELQALCDQYVTMMRNTTDVELDMTSLIVNPSFDQSSTSPKGWTVDGKAVIRLNSSLIYATYGPQPATAYYLSADAGTTVSQTLSDLKPGRYSLSAWLGAQDEQATITLQAGDQTAQAGMHPFGKHYLSETIIPEVEVGADGQLTIAVQGDATFFADEFRLTYLGGTADEDAIGQIAADVQRPQSDAIYTLSGQRITRITRPGIYIVGGRKVLMK